MSIVETTFAKKLLSLFRATPATVPQIQEPQSINQSPNEIRDKRDDDTFSYNGREIVGLTNNDPETQRSILRAHKSDLHAALFVPNVTEAGEDGHKYEDRMFEKKLELPDGDIVRVVGVMDVAGRRKVDSGSKRAVIVDEWTDAVVSKLLDTQKLENHKAIRLNDFVQAANREAFRRSSELTEQKKDAIHATLAVAQIRSNIKEGGLTLETESVGDAFIATWSDEEQKSWVGFPPERNKGYKVHDSLQFPSHWQMITPTDHKASRDLYEKGEVVMTDGRKLSGIKALQEVDNAVGGSAPYAMGTNSEVSAYFTDSVDLLENKASYAIFGSDGGRIHWLITQEPANQIMRDLNQGKLTEEQATKELLIFIAESGEPDDISLMLVNLNKIREEFKQKTQEYNGELEKIVQGNGESKYQIGGEVNINLPGGQILIGCEIKKVNRDGSIDIIHPVNKRTVNIPPDKLQDVQIRENRDKPAIEEDITQEIPKYKVGMQFNIPNYMNGRELFGCEIKTINQDGSITFYNPFFKRDETLTKEKLEGIKFFPNNQ